MDVTIPEELDSYAYFGLVGLDKRYSAKYLWESRAARYSDVWSKVYAVLMPSTQPDLHNHMIRSRSLALPL